MSTARVSNYATFALCLPLLAALGCGAAEPEQDTRIVGGQTGALPASGRGGLGPSVIGAAAGRIGDTGSPVGVLPPPIPAVGGEGGCRPATIAFVIDGSGSMCEVFGNSTRWRELRTALLEKGTGLMYKIDAIASFGLYIYDGTIDLALAGMATGGTPNPMCAGGAALRRTMGVCPQIVEVKPAMNNAARIDAAYPAIELGGSTPTDKAMHYAVDQLIAVREPNQDLNAKPQFIILATDGQPNDICVGGVGGDGIAQQRGVIAAVDKATSLGITTYVISLTMDAALQTHLDEVARHGNPKDPMARTFTPINSMDLIQTLTKLLGTAVGCLF